MTGAKHVPHENFLKLQLILGESLSEISKVCRAVGVPCLSLEALGELRSELLDSLPASCSEQAMSGGLSQAFIETNIKALRDADWGPLQLLLQYATRHEDFDRAWSYFSTPEIRLRLDCLVLSQRCSPLDIAESMEGWSKYPIDRASVEVYSYFFCNMPAMKSLRNWQQYFKEIQDKDHKYFLCVAYDVQTKADLVVLTSDLGVRAAIHVSPEETVNDLLRSAYVQIKKEEQKVRQGIPAKNTAIFEWSGVFCSMLDRVQKLADAGNNENALEIVHANLIRLKNRKIRRISEYDVAKPDGPQDEVA